MSSGSSVEGLPIGVEGWVLPDATVLVQRKGGIGRQWWTRVEGLGFRVQDLRCRVRVEDLEFRVQGSRVGVRGSGFRGGWVRV